jgi:hypothetical protein
VREPVPFATKLGHLNEDQYKQTVERLRTVNGVIKQLDPALRAEAFEILRPYISQTRADEARDEGAARKTTRRRARRNGEAGQQLGIDALLDEHAGDVAAQNGFLIAAIFYAQYGKGPYEVKEFRSFADEHRLLFPEQFNNQVGKAKRDGARVFRKVKDGWQITTHGEKWLGEIYSVSRGTQAKPDG